MAGINRVDKALHEEAKRDAKAAKKAAADAAIVAEAERAAKEAQRLNR